jgi:hypothetical protein
LAQNTESICVLNSDIIWRATQAQHVSNTALRYKVPRKLHFTDDASIAVLQCSNQHNLLKHIKNLAASIKLPW